MGPFKTVVAALSVSLPLLLMPSTAGAIHALGLPFPADHYVCYEAQDNPPAVNPPVVSLSDQFEQALYDPSVALQFCAPANKNNTGIDDPNIHLRRYPIVRVSSTPPVVGVQVLIVNQFETVTLTTGNATDLLVPSTKSLSGVPPPPPTGLEPGYEHYKCYKLPPQFPGITVGVVDQFGARSLQVVVRTRLCNPVQKNADPIRFAQRHLVCYLVKPTLTPPSVTYNNQFGSRTLTFGPDKQLCLPSRKVRL